MSYGSADFNTNIDALNALCNLNNVNQQIGVSMLRLSTNKRINSPADDPAGFVVANSLSIQVDGLNQAISDSQNSMNMLKTATSGMSQITSLISNIKASAQDAAANAGINQAAVQADQQSIQSALQSIQAIAQGTTFGSKNLLDGSAGVASNVTDSGTLGGLSFGGTFNASPLAAGNIAITVNQAATYAQAAGSATYASVNATIATVDGSTTGNGGSVIINGQSVSVLGSDTVQTLINRINGISGSTGVTAGFVSGNGSGSITLTQENYGANFKLQESETSTLIQGTNGTSIAGTNAVATVTANVTVNGNITSTSAQFVGGRASTDSGLRLTDTWGNALLLTPGGNNTGVVNKAVGSAASSPLQFQIGPNAGQTAGLTLPNVIASALGTTSVPGQSLNSIDVTTAAGAANAMNIADEAHSQMLQYQAQVGSFQKNVLQPTINNMSNAVTNLSASVSSILDVNIAQESTKLVGLQALQQAGLSVLKMAANAPNNYLKLLGI